MSEALEQLVRRTELQKLSLETEVLFNKNLKLFKSRFPSIYEAFKFHKPSKAKLHLDPNNNINIADLESRTYLYSRSPVDICTEQINDFSRKARARQFRVVKSQEQNPTHIHIRSLNQLIDTLRSKKHEKVSATPKYLSNLIVSGVGLGYHLIELIKRFKIQNIFIHEHCKDTFFASLHTIDWTIILDAFNQSNRSITFCIAVKPQKALEQIENSLSNIGLAPQMFTFILKHTKRNEEEAFLNSYANELQSFLGGLGYFDDERVGLAHAYHNLTSETFFFKNPRTKRRETRALIIGNGPSLDAHIEYLKAMQNKCVLISCGTALTTLIRVGIKPDFHIEMERPSFIEKMIKLGSTKEERAGITLLCLHTISPLTRDCFEQACMGIKPNDAGTKLVQLSTKTENSPQLAFCNPTVTNCALAYAISMGFMDIHLVGVDLGMKSKHEHHSKDSIYYDIIKKRKDKEILPKREKTLLRPGNFGGEVSTIPVLDMARVALERLLEAVKTADPEFTCVNTNQGALIKNTQTIELDMLCKPKSTDKVAELQSIKQDHFFELKDKPDKVYVKKQLSYFLKIKKDLKIDDRVDSNQALIEECIRIFSLIAKERDEVSHLLLRGTVNCFLSAIIEHCLYCKDNKTFKEKLKIGREAFNQVIDDIYQVMNTKPFVIDDTENAEINKMAEAKSTTG